MAQRKHIYYYFSKIEGVALLRVISSRTVSVGSGHDNLTRRGVIKRRVVVFDCVETLSTSIILPRRSISSENYKLYLKKPSC